MRTGQERKKFVLFYLVLGKVGEGESKNNTSLKGVPTILEQVQGGRTLPLKICLER